MNQEPWCMEGEEWRPVKGYPELEGLYEVSSFGRVRYVGNETERKKHHILMPYQRSHGGRCFISAFSTAYAVSRLVALAFIPNPDNLPRVHIIDGNYRNNRVDNLRWADVAFIYSRPKVRAAISYSVMQKYRTDSSYRAHHLAGTRKHSRPVRCLETGVVYPSPGDAAEACGLSKRAVAGSLRHMRKGVRFMCRTQKGLTVLHFIYADVPDSPLPPLVDETRAIICLETYDVFSSVGDAAANYHLAKVTVYRSCVSYRRKPIQCAHRVLYKPAFHFAYLEDYQKRMSENK